MGENSMPRNIGNFLSLHKILLGKILEGRITKESLFRFLYPESEEEKAQEQDWSALQIRLLQQIQEGKITPTSMYEFMFPPRPAVPLVSKQ